MASFPDNLKPAYSGTDALTKERARSAISTDQLSKHLLSRGGFLERQSRIGKIIESEPLCSKQNQANLSRPDRYHLGLARAKLLIRLRKKYSWSYEDYTMAEYLIDEMSPFFLNHTMFVTTIREQASDEQKKHWLPQIENFDILGAYAQTEMGHGSNVRGLELQARWNPKSHEFVLHSPTLTASKWWNGSMGRTATHAIVVAQLLIPEATSGQNGGASAAGAYKSHGPHTFVVQIRDKKTHLPPPGIIVGDIGPKYGYASMDNGFMLFDNFRVPHSALLSRYSKLDIKTGGYTESGHPATVYGSLTNVRAHIVMQARLILARAVTIAVRYTSIRRQFRDRDSTNAADPEVVVLDYPTVAIRILPLLATTFALHYTGEAMYNLYTESRKNIEKGNFRPLAELHSTSSGLKSLCTTLAADGIETCRRALGGHGFMGSSGLVGINSDYLSKPTVEGDNWMITQQVAAYLIKKMTAVVKSPDTKPTDTTDELFQWYLKTKNRPPMLDLFANDQIDDRALLDSFRWRAADLSYQAYQARVLHKRDWNTLLIQLHKLSRAFSECILVSNFYAALASPTTLSLSNVTVTALRACYRLYAAFTLDGDARTFGTTAAVASASLDALPDAILYLMTHEIRPHAVKLVDAWAIPDYLLDSALGRYDGKVYERLFDLAYRHNPLNRTTFNVDWRSEEIVLGSGDGGKTIQAKL